MKILHNLLLGSLLTLSTTVLAVPTYLKCSSDDLTFNFSADEETGNASLSFLNGGDSFAGKAFFTPTDVNFNARNNTKIGSNQIVMKVSRVDLTFRFKQRFWASLAGQSLGLSSSTRDEKGTCSISKNETVKRLF